MILYQEYTKLENRPRSKYHFVFTEVRGVFPDEFDETSDTLVIEEQMKKYLTYGISVILLAGLIFNAHQSLEKLSPDEAKIRNYGAEIDNLNYQLNQCKILVRGSK